MSRIRSIKPEILDDEKAAHLSDRAWRLWVSMWMIADDHGLMHANARRLHGQALWAQNDPDRTEAALQELADAGLIQLYQVNGEVYACIPRWSRHQKIDHPGKPRFPRPEEGTPVEILESLARPSRELREPSRDPLEASRMTSDHRTSDHRIIGIEGPAADLRSLSNSETAETLELLPQAEPTSSFEDEVQLLWNQLAERQKAIASVRSISKGRRKHVRARQKDALPSIAAWRMLISCIEQQPFLLGANDRGWSVTFDWCIENETNPSKVLEMRYADRASSRPTSIAREPPRSNGERLRRMAEDLEAQARAGPLIERPALPARIDDPEGGG